MCSFRSNRAFCSPQSTTVPRVAFLAHPRWSPGITRSASSRSIYKKERDFCLYLRLCDIEMGLGRGVERGDRSGGQHEECDKPRSAGRHSGGKWLGTFECPLAMKPCNTVYLRRAGGCIADTKLARQLEFACTAQHNPRPLKKKERIRFSGLNFLPPIECESRRNSVASGLLFAGLVDRLHATKPKTSC